MYLTNASYTLFISEAVEQCSSYNLLQDDILKTPAGYVLGVSGPSGSPVAGRRLFRDCPSVSARDNCCQQLVPVTLP